jgi:hypothetical protein
MLAVCCPPAAAYPQLLLFSGHATPAKGFMVVQPIFTVGAGLRGLKGARPCRGAYCT